MPTFSFPLILGAAMIFYVIVMYAVSFFAQRQIHSTEDYVVAGRRLPLSLAWATILATWFGAATVVNQAEEVRRDGVQMAALDPIGAGLCLIVAGLFFAGPLWKMGLLTISDFFRIRFGPRAELLSACVMVPSYFGWIAAQFVALATVLAGIYGGDFRLWMVLVAAVGMGYTLLGGMWSVTLTDAIQIVLVLIGLVVLGIVVAGRLGAGSVTAGLASVVDNTPSNKLQPAPTSLDAFSIWLGALCIGIFGNIPGQDLMQRIFSAKSPTTARSACVLSGVMYLAFGMIPVYLALASLQLIPDSALQASLQLPRGETPKETRIIVILAEAVLHPLPLTVFMLALLSAILSTIDSAILSPATVLSQNIFQRFNRGRFSSLFLNRASVVLVTLASLIMANLGQSAYELLAGAYELTMVGLFVPLALGLFLPIRGERAALAAILTGTGIWLFHYSCSILIGASLPTPPVVGGVRDPHPSLCPAWLAGLNWDLLLGFLPIHRGIFATLAATGMYLLFWPSPRLPKRQPADETAGKDGRGVGCRRDD